MMSKIEKLIDLAIAYFEQQLGEGGEKTVKKSKKAAEPAPEPTKAPTPAEPKGITEADEKAASEEVTRLAMAFIGIKAPGEPGIPANRAALEAHLSGAYKVAALSALAYPQKLQVAQWLKAQLAQAPAAAPAGLGV